MAVLYTISNKVMRITCLYLGMLYDMNRKLCPLPRRLVLDSWYSFRPVWYSISEDGDLQDVEFCK